MIPCGVDLELFKPMEKAIAREMLAFQPDEKLVLFAGAFDNRVKNPTLAKAACQQLENVRLLELKGYKRTEVAILMNAVDACLMTSFTEGSPQFIKEAMACNCPIVSVNVGDVQAVVAETTNCAICNYDITEISTSLNQVLKANIRSNGQDQIVRLKLDASSIAKQIIETYQNILAKRK